MGWLCRYFGTEWESTRKRANTPNLSGIIQPQSSQPAEPLWTDPGIKSGISVRELISTSKNKTKKGAGGELMVEHFHKILACEEKATSRINGQLHWYVIFITIMTTIIKIIIMVGRSLFHAEFVSPLSRFLFACFVLFCFCFVDSQEHNDLWVSVMIRVNSHGRAQHKA